jgi:hypothetical protein
MHVLAAPGSHQPVAQTARILGTARAASANVGIKAAPATAARVNGFAAQQFDGIVTGPFGHTFVAFSGKSSGASEAAGDHYKLLHNDAFRIIVFSVRGTPIVLFLDSGLPKVRLPAGRPARGARRAGRPPHRRPGEVRDRTAERLQAARCGRPRLPGCEQPRRFPGRPGHPGRQRGPCLHRGRVEGGADRVPRKSTRRSTSPTRTRVPSEP